MPAAKPMAGKRFGLWEVLEDLWCSDSKGHNRQVRVRCTGCGYEVKRYAFDIRANSRGCRRCAARRQYALAGKTIGRLQLLEDRWSPRLVIARCLDCEKQLVIRQHPARRGLARQVRRGCPSCRKAKR